MVMRIVFAMAGALVFGTASSENVTPGFNTLIPESILTPDSVETSIGFVRPRPFSIWCRSRRLKDCAEAWNQ